MDVDAAITYRSHTPLAYMVRRERELSTQHSGLRAEDWALRQDFGKRFGRAHRRGLSRAAQGED